MAIPPLPTRGQSDWDDEVSNVVSALDAATQAAAADATAARSDAAYAKNRADEVHTAVVSGADVVTAGFVDDEASATRTALEGGFLVQARTSVDVKSNGALGDGATDDTSAIHAARTAAASFGADLYFPPGTYLTTGLTANVAGQRWVLAKGATVKAVDGATSSVIVVATSSVTITGGGTIDGNRASSSSSVAGVYSSTHTDDLTVEGITIQGTAGYGVELSGSRVRVKDCRFSDIASTAILIGPLTSAIADCEVSGNYIDKSTESVATTYQAISIGGTTSYTNSRPRVTNNHVVMPASPTDAQARAICIEVRAFCPGAVVASNTTSGGAMGVSIDRSAGTIVTGNTITGPNSYGVEIAGSTDCVVSSNTIDGNAVLGGGYDGAQATSGIVTDGASPSDRTLIVGNKIGNMAIGAGSSGIGLTSGTGFTITGNHIAAANHAIVFGQTGSATVSGNRFAGPSFAGSTTVILSNTSGKVVITGNDVATFDRFIDLTATSVTVDNVLVTGNSLFGVTTPVRTNISGTGAIGSSVRVAENSNDRSTPNFPHTVDAAQGSSSSGFTSNRVYYLRSKGSGYISSVGLAVGTSSGNLRVGVYRASGAGRTAIPAARVADSGSVACPVAGYATISLGSSVWVNTGDYLAIQCDNGVATIVGFSLGSGTALGAPFAYIEDPGSFALPATAAPNAGAANMYRLTGV